MKVGDVVNERADVSGLRWIVIGPWDIVGGVPSYNLVGISDKNYGAKWLHMETYLQIDPNQRCVERRLVELLCGTC